MLVASTITGPVASAQQRTIRESLAAEQRPLMKFTGIPSGSSPSIDVVLAETDFLILGQLESPRSYLTPDELDIYTDFEVLDLVEVGHRGAAGSLPKPPKPIIVTFLGGTISIDGLTYTSTHEALPVPAAGTRCLLLLTSTSAGYRIAGKYLGAFGVENGVIAPLTKAKFGRDLHGRWVDEVAREMTEKLR